MKKGNLNVALRPKSKYQSKFLEFQNNVLKELLANAIIR